MKKKIGLVISLFFIVTVMAGCTEYNKPITAESEGIWNQFFVYPLSWLITKVSELASNNYGLGIIFVTILVRFALLPLYLKQTRSMKAMQVIQPELKALQAKYSSKDQKTQEKLQRETMALFQSNNVNPLSGCLPIFFQMPILIAFYHAIMRTDEIKAHSFLYFDLGQPDPYFILPVLAGILTFVQQKITMKGQEDNPQMKAMLYIMPIMIVVFAINLPSALSMYWVVGNVFMIIQTLVVKAPDFKKGATQVGGTKK